MEDSGEAKVFQGSRQLGRFAPGVMNLLYTAVPIGFMLFYGVGNPHGAMTELWIFAAVSIGVMGYFQRIVNKRVDVRLDAAFLVAEGHAYSRTGLTAQLNRWVDAAMGTTTGSALVIQQGGHKLAIGCKGGPSAEDRGQLPATADVRIVVSSPDFHELVAALRRTPASAAHAAPTVVINLVSRPGRAVWLFVPVVGGALWGLGWMITTWMPSLLRNPHPEIPMVVFSVLAVAWQFRGARVQASRNRLQIEDNEIAWVRTRNGKIIERCALRELRCEWKYYVLYGRGTSRCRVVILRWPDGTSLSLGAGGAEVADRTLPRRFFPPRYLIGEGEWEALTRIVRG